MVSTRLTAARTAGKVRSLCSDRGIRDGACSARAGDVSPVGLLRALFVFGTLAAQAAGLVAQGPPPPIVRYTEARAHDVRSTLRLSGSVEAPRTAVVAAEVQGLVGELLAREGDRVAADAPLARLRAGPLELGLRAKRGELAEAEARHQETSATLERYRQLFTEELISQEEYDKARYDREAWQGRLDQLRAEAGLLEREIERTTVRAPFAGVVTRDYTEAGQWLSVGDPVVELISLDELDVRVEVPAEYFSKLQLRRGTHAPVRFQSNGRPGAVIGHVRAVVPRASPQARTFPVLVRLPRESHAVGVGMLAEVELPLGQPQPAVIVPKDALIATQGEPFVYRLRDDDTVERTSVSVGSGVGDWIAVGGGIAAGDRVIIRGNERLQPGAAVRAERQEYPPP